MLNKDIFVLDPHGNNLINDGVVKLNTARDDSGQKVIAHEIRTFVCEGEYQSGLERLLSTYLNNFDKPEQPAAWVSGFFGSGKSHLVKMLSYFWEDFEFSNGDTARKLKRLPDSVNELLVELHRLQKLRGKLVVRGTMKDYPAKDVRYAFIQLLLRALNLPDQLHYFQFYDWCKKEGILDKINHHLKEAGKSLEKEIKLMFVSSPLNEALLQAMPDFAENPAQARQILKATFPRTDTISQSDFISVIKDQILPYVGDQIPCILVVLDEIQQYIGTDENKSSDVQFLAEDLCSNFNGKLLLVGTGQNALRDTPLLQRLNHRFTVKVNLTDQDVDRVNRKTVLEKKASAQKTVDQLVEGKSGEISRLLQGTEYGYVTDDRENLVADYPIMPSVRKLWKQIIKAIDVAGTSGQLRSQLRVVDEAVKEVADKPLGHFIPADFIFTQKKGELLQSGLLLNDVSSIIEELHQRGGDGRLKARIMSNVFLIEQLKRLDKRYHLDASKENIADLMISELDGATDDFRNKINGLIDELVNDDKFLVRIEDQYRLQTKVGAEWEQEFSRQSQKIQNDEPQLYDNRKEYIVNQLRDQFRPIFIKQGKSGIGRDFTLHTTDEKPKIVDKLNLWLRDGWIENETVLMDEIRQEGNDQAIVYLYIKKNKDRELRREIVKLLAAQATLAEQGNPSSPEGEQASRAMRTRAQLAEIRIKDITTEICRESKVFLAGGSQVDAGSLNENVKNALEKIADRQFKDFVKADYTGWERALRKSFTGNSQALEEIGFGGEVKEHPTTNDILSFIGAGSKQGREIRNQFARTPYGWSQDAIDTMLMVLKLTDHISTSETNLNIRSIAQAAFKKEIFTLTAKQKMAVRGVFQALGIHCKSGEEVRKSNDFLNKANDLIRNITGDAPRPESEDDSLIRDLEQLDGNERLLKIAEHKDDLKQSVTGWQQKAEKIAQRWPDWELLIGLSRVAPDEPELTDIRNEVNTILNDRLLLSEPNPVPGPLDRLTGILRDKLNKYKQDCIDKYDAEMPLLQQNEYFSKLKPEDKHTILRDTHLLAKPEIKSYNAAELLQQLRDFNLSAWDAKLTALPGNFQKAVDKAIELSAPKAKSFHVPRKTIRTKDELNHWLDELKNQIEQLLDDGDVILK